MQLSNDPFSRCCRLVFCLTMALVWSGLDRRAMAQISGSAPANDSPTPPAQPLDAQQTADLVDHYYQLVEAGDRQIPRESFDAVPIVRALNANPDAMFQWVRDHTFWIPYHGALRGPTGMLMDRQGNSLDRALLLAYMFHLTGKTVRLAHADLPPAMAKDLLAKVRPVPSNPLMPDAGATTQNSTPANTDTLETLCQKCGVDPAQAQMNLSRARLEVQRLQEGTYERVADQAPAVAALAGNSPGSSAGDDRAEAISDHWWVQMADPSGSQWIDFDPLTPDAASGHALATPSRTIPLPPEDGKIHLDDSLCHRVQIKAVVERWSDGRLSQSTVLSVSLRPAEHFGQQITLINIAPDFPGDFDYTAGDVESRLKTALLDQHEWVPALIVGSDQTTQSGFTDSGQIDEKPVLDATARTGKKVGSSVQGVLDAFNTAPPAPSAPSGNITAEWIDYEVDSPGQPPTTVRREVFDLLGPAARAANPTSEPTITDSDRYDRALALAGPIDILPTVNQLSTEFMAHMVAKGILGGRKLMVQSIRQGGSLKLDEWNDLLKSQMSMPGRLYAFSAMRLAASRFRAQLYYDRPNIVSYHRDLRQNAKGNLMSVEAIDIVANQLAVRDGSNVDPFAVRMEQGVVDTVVESMLIVSNRPAANTSDLFARRDADSSEWVAIHKGDTAALAKLGLTADQRARIEQDLAGGNIVIAPTRTKANADQLADVAWWVVNPATGQTLGMGDRGWGAALAEYAALTVLVGIVAFLACAGMANIGTQGSAVLNSNKALVTCIGVAVLAAAAVPLGVLAAGGMTASAAGVSALGAGGLGIGNAALGGFGLSGVK
jgi:hypothetical protein